jgi:hypothetical protein
MRLLLLSVGIGFTVTVPASRGQPFKVYTTVYSVVIDGDTVIEAVVAQYSINKFHQLLFLFAVIVAFSGSITNRYVCYF